MPDFIVDEATGEVAPESEKPANDPAAVELGWKGGLKGGEGEGRKAVARTAKRVCQKGRCLPLGTQGVLAQNV